MREPNGWTRRDFLTSTSCLGAAMACARFLPAAWGAESIAQDPRVAATPLLDKGFASTRRIGDGVYATIADPTKGLDAMCNGGFVAGKDAALLIEGHFSPTGAAYELEALRMVSQAPLRGALDTHYHFDHSFGNAFYGAQRIPIWAHKQAIPLMVERYAGLQGRDLSAMVAPAEKRVREAADETERQRAQSDLGMLQIVTQTVSSTVVALPNLPLEPAKLPMTVDLGGVKAVIETYPGHTPTDLIVRVPEQNIVFTGDLLFNGSYPVAFDAEMSAWIRTLDTFAAFSKDTLFVPGHGPVCGPEGIATERAVLEDLREHAQKMYRAGVPVEEAQRRYVQPESFKSLRYFSWSFSIGAAIEKFYAEFKAGKM
ncbi:MAG: MBL fold metallo-hydrolase [Acidobacteria bacterium]|nr:MBL fold metallo-hydrolase [Acidobacteriota bacterium]MBI3662547.1 MBL fold metallo-hydrolase [Acidobacteriota bacterium]